MLFRSGSKAEERGECEHVAQAVGGRGVDRYFRLVFTRVMGMGGGAADLVLVEQQRITTAATKTVVRRKPKLGEKCVLPGYRRYYGGWRKSAHAHEGASAAAMQGCSPVLWGVLSGAVTTSCPDTRA